LKRSLVGHQSHRIDALLLVGVFLNGGIDGREVMVCRAKLPDRLPCKGGQGRDLDLSVHWIALRQSALYSRSHCCQTTCASIIWRRASSKSQSKTVCPSLSPVGIMRSRAHLGGL
jgi:hypothetical protein